MARGAVHSLILVMLISGCDAVEPGVAPVLVVEAFFDEGRAVGQVTLRRSLPMDVPYIDANGVPVADAEPRLRLGDEWFGFAPVGGRPGTYTPIREVVPRAGDRFDFEVSWHTETAAASGVMPPRITISDARVDVPDRPIEAVLLDSLQLDSLQTGARSGYVYLVEVSIWWSIDEGSESLAAPHWIRAQLRPYTTFESGVTELFFKSERIFREDLGANDGNGVRRWTGVYLVPVAGEDVPIPPHSVRVSLLRSTEDYARFASSRQSPERREPISNVRGGVGIVAGISVDSLTLQVP